MNQGGWLEDSVSFCNSRDNNLEVEYVGNSDPGNTCVAPRFFT